MPPLTLTILGSSPAAPNPGGACSGYLVREGATALLMDCGSGVASRVSPHFPPADLAAITISHLHPDHYFDLIPLYYVIKFGTGLGPAGRVPLYVPPGGVEHLATLTTVIDRRSDMLDDIFDIQEYAAGRTYVLGSLSVTFHPVQHYVVSHAARVTSSDGKVLVFSSDVAPCLGLVEAARDADLLMCESAMLDLTQDHPDPAQRGHTTAAEAGEMARRAGARQLVITHYRSGPEADAHHRLTAAQTFGQPVELAREGETYTVG